MRILLSDGSFVKAEPPFGDNGSCFIGEVVEPHYLDYVDADNITDGYTSVRGKYDDALLAHGYHLSGYADTGYWVMPIGIDLPYHCTEMVVRELKLKHSEEGKVVSSIDDDLMVVRYE
jgi:hypothetical protein